MGTTGGSGTAGTSDEARAGTSDGGRAGTSDGGPARGVGPWRPEGVEVAWLQAVLQRAEGLGGGSLEGFEVEPVGTGQMADSFRFRLRYTGTPPPTAPASVVGKFTAASSESRATSVSMRTAEVEVRFYQQVADTVAARTPRCFHADVVPETAEFVLILEDLAPGRVGDQLTGCPLDDAALALEELARLHASRWGDPRLASLDWLSRRGPEADQVSTVVFSLLFSGFVDRYRERLDDDALGVGERLFARIGEYLVPPPGPRTVQHADYRLDNLLFGVEGGPGRPGPAVGIVDWQTVTLGLGASDVSYFLGGSLEVEDRRRHERELVRHYHRELWSRGVSDFSWEACWGGYRRAAYDGYIMAVGASMLVERTERGDEMFLAMLLRHTAQILDLDAEALIGSGT